MLQINKQNIVLVGPSGSITVPKEDEITSKIAMLYEGQCESLGQHEPPESTDFPNNATSSFFTSILSMAPSPFKTGHTRRLTPIAQKKDAKLNHAIQLVLSTVSGNSWPTKLLALWLVSSYLYQNTSA